jgi:quercetin dioxygenase-like cupin family protein
MRRINLDSLPWVERDGVRFKSAVQGGRQVRLVEFAPGFRDTEWCGKMHVGYLLAGSLEILFTDGAEVLSAGDALLIAAGEMHRARVVEGPARISC